MRSYNKLQHSWIATHGTDATPRKGFEKVADGRCHGLDRAAKPMTTIKTDDSTAEMSTEQIRERFNIDVSDVYATAVGDGLGGVKSPAFEVDAGSAPTLALVDACYERVLLDTTVADPEGVTAGALAKLTPAQADELADALRKAAADVREYTGEAEA